MPRREPFLSLLKVDALRTTTEPRNALPSIKEQQEWTNQSAPPLKERPATYAIPCMKEALERDLERVQEAWDDSQADRRRDAIYGYLEAVCDLVNWWSAESCEVDRARQDLRLRGLLPWPVKTSMPRGSGARPIP
jgi:hypothetical protein